MTFNKNEIVNGVIEAFHKILFLIIFIQSPWSQSKAYSN